MTADHDDRVVPAHSFKFAARLQEFHKSESPALIRIETNAGHGAGKSVAASIQENVDIQAFTLYNMGFKELKYKNSSLKETSLTFFHEMSLKFIVRPKLPGSQ